MTKPPHPMTRTKLYRATKKKVLAVGGELAERWPEIGAALCLVHESNPYAVFWETRLSYSFVWSDTPQGREYWAEIDRALQ